MKTIRVTFADGNTLTTQINGTEAEIRAYYLGKKFQFGDTEENPSDKLVEAVNVEFLKSYKYEFEGRKTGAIGRFYKTSETIEAFSPQEAAEELRRRYEHIRFLHDSEKAQ
jgi:hypothetical protein